MRQYFVLSFPGKLSDTRNFPSPRILTPSSAQYDIRSPDLTTLDKNNPCHQKQCIALNKWLKRTKFLWRNGKSTMALVFWHTSVTASLAGLAISLTRHWAMGALCSFKIAAALWSSSALFHRGVLAHDFCASFAVSITLFTSSCVQAAEIHIPH